MSDELAITLAIKLPILQDKIYLEDLPEVSATNFKSVPAGIEQLKRKLEGYCKTFGNEPVRVAIAYDGKAAPTMVIFAPENFKFIGGA
ncbi:MAG: hypothetical protein ABA06_03200 [Parcubacteria bacterium C7867-001]|nr:MAG: hypothetical protein ABA06_03200 [Parcubacteria bacterium C7867-001]